MINIEGFFQVIKQYPGDSYLFVLFLAALLYLLVKSRGRRRKRYILIVVLSLLFVFNPVMYKVICKVGGSETYYRFIWAVPMLYVIAKAVIDIISSIKYRWGKWLAAVVIAVIIILSKSSYPSLFPLPNYQNIYNIPDDVIAIAEIIAQDNAEENPVIAADIEIMLNIRCYDASFVWGVTRDALQKAGAGDWYPEASKEDVYVLKMLMFGSQENTETVQKRLAYKNVSYIVTQYDFGMDEYMDLLGYTRIGQTEQRVVYARKKDNIEGIE